MIACGANQRASRGIPFLQARISANILPKPPPLLKKHIKTVRSDDVLSFLSQYIKDRDASALHA
jgi:hypothetical protein